jgi:hypothetical protein
MQQSALSGHRPLLFTSKADLHFFVHGNPSQTSLNLPTYPAPYPARTAPAFHPTTSLFDRYFRTNLQLRECDPRDITTVVPNLVLHEQPLSRYLLPHAASLPIKLPIVALARRKRDCCKLQRWGLRLLGSRC